MQPRWGSFEVEESFPKKRLGVQETNVIQCSAFRRETSKHKGMGCLVPHLMVGPPLRITSCCVVDSPLELRRVEEVDVLVVSLRGLAVEGNLEVDSNVSLGLVLLLVEVLDVEWVLDAAKK